MSRTAVYIHHGAQGPLYVGITNNPAKRLRQHMASSPWAAEIQSVSLEWCEGRPAASKLEKRLVEAHRPPFNKVVPNGIENTACRELCDGIGRSVIASALGLRTTAVSNACVRGVFPPSWFFVISDLANEAGLYCPVAAFRFATRHNAPAPA